MIVSQSDNVNSFGCFYLHFERHQVQTQKGHHLSLFLCERRTKERDSKCGVVRIQWRKKCLKICQCACVCKWLTLKNFFIVRFIFIEVFARPFDFRANLGMLSVRFVYLFRVVTTLSICFIYQTIVRRNLLWIVNNLVITYAISNLHFYGLKAFQIVVLSIWNAALFLVMFTISINRAFYVDHLIYIFLISTVKFLGYVCSVICVENRDNPIPSLSESFIIANSNSTTSVNTSYLMNNYHAARKLRLLNEWLQVAAEHLQQHSILKQELCEPVCTLNDASAQFILHRALMLHCC